jgi:MOSC domain-containing protein YiiM
MSLPALTLHSIFISEGHKFFGRHGLGPAMHPIQELESVECVADQGLRGDRFFGSTQRRQGQVTLFSREVFDGLRTALRLDKADPSALRRNLLVSGADLNTLIGKEFELQGIRLFGVEECRPCYWMNTALGSGAEDWLCGRGGLRCRVLTSGWLHASATFQEHDCAGAILSS